MRRTPLRNLAAAARLVGVLAGLAAMSACGYRAGLAPALGEGREADSIGVEIFGNQSQLPNLERELHQATTDSARRYLDLELASPQHADLILRGSIKGFRRQEGARTADNLTLETTEIVVVEALLVDRVLDEVVGRTTFETRVGTAIDVPGREPEQRERALKIAADRLVLTLLAGLEYGVTRPTDG